MGWWVTAAALRAENMTPLSYVPFTLPTTIRITLRSPLLLFSLLTYVTFAFALAVLFYGSSGTVSLRAISAP